MKPLQDTYGRTFRYLRLSVTDRCNFRCVYCLPNGYEAPSPSRAPELSPEEIHRLAAGFDMLGFTKIRLTGGEPTLRRDILEVVGALSGFPRLRTIAITTNGHNLEKLAAPLRRLGVGALNVSLDSLDPARFAALTGRPKLDAVLRGIEAALDCGFASVKVNAVLMKGLNEQDIPAFLDWVRTRPVSVRFIELMRTGRNSSLFQERHLGAGELQLFLRKNGWMEAARGPSAGPAVEYSHPGYAGRIGLIAPYSQDFCLTCNRLRVSSRGDLRLCLFGEEDYPLRPALAGPGYREEVAARVRAMLTRKPESHYLKEGKYGNTWNLASIGG